MSIKSYYQKNGKKFFEVYIGGHDSGGRRVQFRRRSVPTLKKAEKIQFELKRELAKLKEQRVPYRWDEWFDECLKRMKLTMKPSTVMNYDKQLRKWVGSKWGQKEIHAVTKTDIYNLVFEKVESKFSPHTRKTILKQIRRIFQMAVEEGILNRNPCLGVQVKVPEVEQKVLSNDEVGIFLREARVTNHRFYPVWTMALMTGMRSGELFALKWSDIDLEARIISVSRQWTNKNGFGTTKTQRNRVVPISDDLLKFLKELRLKSDKENEFVLPQLKEWKNGDQAKVTREFCETIGVTSVKFHDLRATFITNLLSRGVSLARVMSIVGHRELKTTNGYLRKAGVEVKGATNELGYRIPEIKPAQVLSLLEL